MDPCICISGCQQSTFYSIFCQIPTVLEPVPWPGTMNVRNEPLHDMACVLKRGNPPNEGGNFVSLNMEKGYQFWE